MYTFMYNEEFCTVDINTVNQLDFHFKHFKEQNLNQTCLLWQAKSQVKYADKFPRGL